MRLLLLFLALSLVVLGIWIAWGGSWQDWAKVNHVVEQMQKHGVAPSLVGYVLLLLDLIFPIPGTVVMSALGFIYGIWWGGLIALAGSTTAGIMGYGIGRVCPQRWVIKFLGEKDFSRGTRLFERGGGLMVAISRAVPILPEALSVTAGMMRMPWRKFFLALLCGNIPMAFVFSWIGASGRDNPSLAALLSLLLPAFLWSAAWWHDRKRHT